MKTVMSVVAAALVALSAPVHASVIYDFVQTAEGGTYDAFPGVQFRLTLSDEGAAQASIEFKQIPQGHDGPPINIGSGIEQFAFGLIGRTMTDRLPLFMGGFQASLTALLNGGLSGSISLTDQSDSVYLDYDTSTGLWQGNAGLDYMSSCHHGTTCTFSGYWQQVPEPSTVVLLLAPLLLLVRRRLTA